MDTIIAGVLVLAGLVIAAHTLADAIEEATAEISARLDLLLEPEEE